MDATIFAVGFGNSCRIDHERQSLIYWPDMTYRSFGQILFFACHFFAWCFVWLIASYMLLLISYYWSDSEPVTWRIRTQTWPRRLLILKLEMFTLQNRNILDKREALPYHFRRWCLLLWSYRVCTALQIQRSEYYVIEEFTDILSSFTTGKISYTLRTSFHQVIFYYVTLH